MTAEGNPNNSEAMTFWEHLDVLRGSLIRMIIASLVAAVVAFCLKDILFGIVFAPADSGFITYRLMETEPFRIKLINTALTEQFMVHMKISLAAGIFIASPYLLYVLFRFVSPALYERERRYSVRLAVAAYVAFIVGVLLNYFIVFPFTVRFLGTYRLSAEIDNMLSVSSYADTFLSMSLIFGLVFELPVLSWFLGRVGLLRASWMSRLRRHAVVVILIVAAVVTPTSDVLTLLLVSVPIWLLYELSILLVRVTENDDE